MAFSRTISGESSEKDWSSASLVRDLFDHDQKSLEKVSGVSAVKIDFGKKTATVAYDRRSVKFRFDVNESMEG
jgi:hypothetical protein